jgi:hypothetical protein
MPEHLEAPSLPARVHLDRFFRKLTPEFVALAKVRKRS